MALSQLFRGFWDDPWEGMSRPSRLYDQHLGSLVPDDFFSPGLHPHHHTSLAPRRRHPQHMSGTSEVMNTDKEFRINIDVVHFKPDEISVKAKDNRVIIHARHEDRADEHGYIMREFSRQYVLPKDVDPKTVKSSLTPDGILVLKAPKMAIEDQGERPIPITHETA